MKNLIFLMALLFFISCEGGQEEGPTESFSGVPTSELIDNNWSYIEPAIGDYSGSCAYDLGLDGSYNVTEDCTINISLVEISEGQYDLIIKVIDVPNADTGVDYTFDEELGYFMQDEVLYQSEDSNSHKVFDNPDVNHQDEFSFIITNGLSNDTQSQGIVRFVDSSEGIRFNVSRVY